MWIEVYQIHGQDSRSSPFFFVKKKNSFRIDGVQERRTKIQATARPDSLWPELWSGMSKAAQKKEKQEWAMEKPKLDNARKLRGVLFFLKWVVRGRDLERTHYGRRH